MEAEAAGKLLGLLPDELRGAYEPLLREEDAEVRALVKAADKLAAYRRFLTLGGSMDPLDELKVAGVDLSTPEPVQAALVKFNKVLTEAEELAEKL